MNELFSLQFLSASSLTSSSMKTLPVVVVGSSQTQPSLSTSPTENTMSKPSTTTTTTTPSSSSSSSAKPIDIQLKLQQTRHHNNPLLLLHTHDNVGNTRIPVCTSSSHSTLITPPNNNNNNNNKQFTSTKHASSESSSEPVSPCESEASSFSSGSLVSSGALMTTNSAMTTPPLLATKINSSTLSTTTVMLSTSSSHCGSIVSSLTPLPSSATSRYLPLSDSDTNIETLVSNVQLAYDTETGQNVILKQVFDKAEFEHERDMLDELSRLDIPYVIRLQDIVPPSLHSKQALVFPQLSKFQSLSIHNLVDVARWMRQLMTALAKLHRNGIAHLDISSSNIMLLASDHKNNNCKTNTTTTILSTTTTAAAEEHEFDDKRPSLVLIDFGLSRLFSGRPTDCHPQGRGTCGYVAPEMLSGDAHTGSPDIYSAGVILGQFLQPYISDPSLAYLGSKLVRPSTTTHISMRLRELFDDQFYETTTSPLMIRMSSSPATALAGFNGGPHHNTNGTPIWKSMVRKAADLLAKMLEPDASTRITAAAALAHPFLMASEKDGDFEGTDLEAYSKFLQTNSYSAMYPSRKQSYIVRYR